MSKKSSTSAVAPSPRLSDESPGRRLAIKALFGTVLGGAMGYGGYPWIAGDHRQEFADALQKAWDGIKEHHSMRRRREMVERQSRPVPVMLDAHGRDYEAFLTALHLRHLTPLEILRPHFKVRGTVANCLPPRELWPNIATTLRVADEIRQQLGVGLDSIASAYRCPAYNAACPGAARASCHMQNLALDLVYDCAPEQVVKTAEALRAKSFFKGGIGRYAGFTHIDARGTNADW
jgi:hypothetical protein